MINLRSDNETGAHPAIIEAVSLAFTSGSTFSYGADAWTQRVQDRLRMIFQRDELVAKCVMSAVRSERKAGKDIGKYMSIPKAKYTDEEIGYLQRVVRATFLQTTSAREIGRAHV